MRRKVSEGNILSTSPISAWVRRQTKLLRTSWHFSVLSGKRCVPGFAKVQSWPHKRVGHEQYHKLDISVIFICWRTQGSNKQHLTILRINYCPTSEWSHLWLMMLSQVSSLGNTWLTICSKINVILDTWQRFVGFVHMAKLSRCLCWAGVAFYITQMMAPILIKPSSTTPTHTTPLILIPFHYLLWGVQLIHQNERVGNDKSWYIVFWKNIK